MYGFLKCLILIAFEICADHSDVVVESLFRPGTVFVLPLHNFALSILILDQISIPVT